VQIAEIEDIDRLNSRLQWEAGPFADLSSRGLEGLIAGVSTLAAQLREKTEDRPLRRIELRQLPEPSRSERD